MHQERTKIMRGFARQWRGQGHVFGKWVRHTERLLLACGQPIRALGQQAQQLIAQAHELPDSPRARLLRELHVAMGVQEQIRKQSRPLTHGKKPRHSKILTLTDFLGGNWRKGLTAAGGEAILGLQRGRVCHLPFASGLRRMTPCSASYACPLPWTSFFSP